MRRFTHTFPQRISAFLLCLALLVGLLPSAAFAAGTDTGKAIQLVDSGTAANIGGGQADNIYFGTYQQRNAGSTKPGGTEGVDWIKSDTATYQEQGPYYYIEPVKWRVLSNANGQLFLLSDQNLDVKPYNSSETRITWEKSTIRSWLNGYEASENNSGTDYTSDNFIGTAFSEKEQEAIANTEVVNDDNPEDYTEGGNNTTDKIFLLSIAEANNSGYFADNSSRIATNTAYVAGGGTISSSGMYDVGAADYWWLRSPGRLNNAAAYVSNTGYVDSNGVYVSDPEYAVRPAFNLNLNSVLFTSAAEGGKSPAAASGGQSGEAADAIFEICDYAGNEWKLTLLDSTRNSFAISNATKNSSGDTIAFSYSGAQTGTNEYVSVVIEDSGAITHYGRILQLDGTTNGASGTASLTLPDGALGDTTKLYVFNEQYNGDKMTDYASPLKEISSPTVDTTAPTLSNGSATRDSATTATVKFTSDEAGTYYYAVVESDETAPTIDTAGTGTACDTTEQTISLNNLSGAGAKYIYIAAKDAVGNVSEKLKITIPAIYTLTVNLNGGSGSTAGGEYTEGTAVPIDAGSRSNYRFTGWTSSNGGTFADASSASTTFTMPAGNVTITANWQYDPPYIPPTKPDGPSTGTSDGWEGIVDELADAEDGDTITIDMNGETEVPGDIWEAIAGKDVTVILDMGEDISWTVDGSDVPTATSFSSMDFGVDMNTSGIDVDVINTVTGEVSSVQITLAHDGEFGFALTLTAPLGKENAGYWANLYHYNEVGKTLDFETSAQVASDGTASLRMTHASQYAIVIDDKSHALPFADLGEGQWYESAVRYAYTHDIMEGMSATTFQPNGTLSRAMAVQIFYNLEGQPDISGENLGYPYEDVNAQAWYGDAVYWARITGVATGYGDGTFQPGDSITRQEFAQMLYNYAKYKGYDLTAEGDLSQFPDSGSVADWAETAMSWANGNELINGHDDGTLEPGGTATRAQAASILMRFDQNMVEN